MIVNGWLDWATHIPGPADKRYSAENRGLGICHHSVVGTTGASDKLDRVFSTQRLSDGSYAPYAAMSVMFYLRLDGRLIQYYPVTASTWTSGNRTANTSFWAIEHEGGGPDDEDEDGVLYNTPITQAQSDTLMRVYMEWEARTGRAASRGNLVGSRLVQWGDNPDALGPSDRTLWEHKEVALWDVRNAGPTACPSNRFRNHWLEEDMGITEDRAREIAAEAVGAYRDNGVSKDLVFLLEQMTEVVPSSFDADYQERIRAIIGKLQGNRFATGNTVTGTFVGTVE